VSLAGGVRSCRRLGLAAVQRCRKLACLSQMSGRQASDVVTTSLSPTPTIAAWSGEAAIHHGFSLATSETVEPPSHTRCDATMAALQ